MAAGAVTYGAQSMVAPLHHVLVKTPGAAFAAAYDDPVHAYRHHRHPVSLTTARREQARFVVRGSASPCTSSAETEICWNGSGGPTCLTPADPSL